MNNQIFDPSSRAFASQIDAAIAEGGYLRGQLFVDAIKMGVPSDGLILDYGCGPGRIAGLLVQRGYRVDGVDPSPLMLHEAAALQLDPARVTFRLGDDNGDGLVEASYDGIVCSSVIEFVPDPACLLKNLYRALKPGGCLAISFSNRRSLWRAYAKWRYGHRLPHFKIQHNSWTFSESFDLLTRTGFSVDKTPIYYEASPFDKRPALKRLSSLPYVGTLGFVTARRS